MDFLAYIAVRAIVGLARLLPHRVQLSVLSSLIYALSFLVSKYQRIAMKNLELAFPEKDLAWRKVTFKESCRAFARIFVDLCRLDQIDQEWIAEHIESPFIELVRRLNKEYPGKGILMVTGHLGSFELLAHTLACAGHPISFVVRNFKLPKLDEWWTSLREAKGNKVIGRKGAIREVISTLETGRGVALLFDQNVTRNHAVFVDFFGRKAATSKALAIAALRTKAPVIVVSISCPKDDFYKVDAVEVDLRKFYQDDSIDSEKKIELITQIFNSEYERMVRANPGEWFWMHRRWKTAPTKEEEGFYG